MKRAIEERQLHATSNFSKPIAGGHTLASWVLVGLDTTSYLNAKDSFDGPFCFTLLKAHSGVPDPSSLISLVLGFLVCLAHPDSLLTKAHGHFDSCYPYYRVMKQAQ